MFSLNVNLLTHVISRHLLFDENTGYAFPLCCMENDKADDGFIILILIIILHIFHMIIIH
ncbi:hypothetical protein D083_0619 [Dickeya solani RNS 08.23.3.1.A]|nr:hypothetical protein D083_0619 [Dickeya solani RNS 08.23.3.1.A]